MSLDTLGTIAVVIAIVAAIIVRRLSWSPLQTSDTDVWRGPLAMVGIGLYQLHDKLTGTPLTVTDVVLLAAGVALAVAGGFGTGRVAQVQTRAGKVFYRLGVAGLGVMAGCLVLRLGLAGIAYLTDATMTRGGGMILLTMGAELLVQSLLIQSRARQQDQQVEETASR